MLIALIVVIVLAILASITLAGKAIQLWVVIPCERDHEKHAEKVWQQRMSAKMLICPSLFLFVFGLSLNSLVEKTGGDVPYSLGIFLCLFLTIGFTILGLKTYSERESEPNRKDENVFSVFIGFAMYISIICMMILGNLIQSDFLTPLSIGVAVLATGMMMVREINEIEFPGSEFIRAGIIFTIIGGVLFWDKFLGLNWF